ncbi:MAG TPA: carboxypeptidase M32 [Candidatus Hydrogenedentes bacterium]|nr:carboxypeptidase M32 [Candidatus Hydrogenedentota bacterium]
MSDAPLGRLRERLGEIADLRAAADLLHWDQEVNMPPKAAAGRGRQLATVAALAHRMFTDAEMGEFLKELQDGAHALAPDDAALVNVTAYDYVRATKLPETFVHTFAEETSKAYEAWVKAREISSFPAFQPHLETLLELLKKKADLLGYEGSPYNALLDEYERGMRIEQLEAIFAELAPKQAALVERLVNATHPPDTTWTRRDWPESRQWDLTVRILSDMGYDFEAGRQDKSVHPFTTSFGLHDVRVTTRFDAKDPFSAVSSSMHEGGHALYDQGFQEQDARTPLAEGASVGIHESQSRMWENMIGRSLPFSKHYRPLLNEFFPDVPPHVSAEDVYRTVNCVKPSLIRVEADECTYNLHVIMRFEIELALIEERMVVAEIPEVWSAKMKEYLGIAVPNDAQGCLQDIHWSLGSMGYFPSYALGNLYAAQIFERILEDIPDLWGRIESGRFYPLLHWLREHVHRHGRRKLATEMIRDITGAEPMCAPYLRYLETKYGELYGV